MMIQTDAEQAFLQRLRSETAPQHQQLEQNPLSAALMRPDVRKDDYAAYLSYMYRVIEYCEQTVFPAIKDIADTSGRHKLPALAADLAFLGKTPHSEDFVITPGPLSAAQAMGYMYVIEGSTLGGRVILKHISKTIPVNATAGAAYFHGYEDETGSRWKNFLQELTDFTVNNRCEEAVITAATHAFTAIGHYFSRK